MPNSRRHQSIQDYMNTLKSALQDPLLDGNIFEFVEGTGNLSFVIKQSVEGSTTKTLLFKHEFHEVLLQQGIFDLYDKIGGVLARQREAILSLETNLALSQSTILSLQSDMQQFVDEKEKSQDQMVRGMCLLLNTKKREIERLRRELPREGNDDDMVDDSDDAAEVSSKPKETKRKVRKTKAAAPIKRKKEPERTPSYLVSQSQELSGDNIIDYLSQPAAKSRQTKRAASQSKSKAPVTKVPKKTKRKAKESSSEEEEDEVLDTETSEDDIDLHLDSASDPERFQETGGRQDLDDGEDSDFGGAEDRATHMNVVTPSTTLSSRMSSLPNTTQESISLSEPSSRYSSKRAPAIAKSTLSMSSSASNYDLSRKNIGSIQGKSSSKDATSIESQAKDKVPAPAMAKVRKTAMQRMLGSDSENSS